MMIVTEEEYSLLEEILMPGLKEGSSPLRLSGTTFITLYESISRRVRRPPKDKVPTAKKEGKMDGIKFLSNFRNRKLSGGGLGGSDTGGRMDGTNFLWKFLAKNLPDQGGITQHPPTSYNNNKLTKSPPSKGIIFINKLLKRTKENDTTSKLLQQKGTQINHTELSSTEKKLKSPGMTGIRFLWTFFSNELPDQLESSIQRRNEEFRKCTDQLLTEDKKSSHSLQDINKEDEDSDTSSDCSSISFVTASSTTSEEEINRSTMIDPVTSTPNVKILGTLDSQEESYLETPSSSDEESIFADRPVTSRVGGSDEISWQKARDYFETLWDYHLNKAENSTLIDDSFANLLAPEN